MLRQGSNRCSFDAMNTQELRKIYYFRDCGSMHLPSAPIKLQETARQKPFG